ncbi:MAG TPA: hypothetical protein VIU64_04585, partial [Polyangia bacterium]
MLRIFPALLGAGLAILWVIGLSIDATVWLTWIDGIAAALSFASVGLIPERRGSLWAAFCLGLLALGLFVLWMLGLEHRATPWLTWWTLVAAALAGATAVGAAIQG